MCLPDSIHLVLAQRKISDMLLQPTGHPAFQMWVQVGGKHSTALIVFSALDPCQKFQRTLAAKILQNRFRIAGQLSRSFPVHMQTVELSGSLPGDAPDQPEIPAVQLLQRALITAVISADQFLIGHGSHPPLLSVDALGACSLW